MRWALAAGASCACFCAVAFSTLVPLHDPSGIQYVFVWEGAAALSQLAAATILLIVAFYGVVVFVASRSPSARSADARSGRWLAPLCALALAVLGILPAVPGAGERAAVVGYWFYDLRWWWAALLGGGTLMRVDDVLGFPIRRRLSRVALWSAPARLLLGDAIVFALLIAWAVATTPAARFIGVLRGDEPKYLRYCEVWYEGGGLDISNETMFSDQRLDARPHLLANGARLLGAFVTAAHDLASDTGDFVAHPSAFHWNRSEGSGGFLHGKHGGIYEVHQPGLSAVLFPGYLLDRYLLGFTTGYQNEHPAELVMTNLTMLIVYGLCGVALFRLLRRALVSDVLAGVWAIVTMATLPMTAFAFQFYPELPALLIVLVVSNYALFHARSAGPTSAAYAGGATAALAWLHPRFLGVAAALVAFCVIRGTTRARRAAAVTFGAVVLSLMFYDYHVTGSWSPGALWAANHDSAPGFSASWAVAVNFTGYVFDRVWGLLPHSLMLVGALPGLLVIARESRAHAIFVAVVGLALAIPAAGHTLNAAGTTPDRLILAVVPLLAWPVAAFIRRFWGSTTLRVLTVMAIATSLDSALAYNWNNDKTEGFLRDVSSIGWKPNLAFPNVRTEWSLTQPNFVLLLIMIALAGALTALAYIHLRRPNRAIQLTRRPVWLTAMALVPAVIVAAFAATSFNKDWTSENYLMTDRQARRRAAEALVALDRCRVCFTSQRAQVDWTWLSPNPAHDPAVDVDVDRRTVKVRVNLGSDSDVAGFGRMRVAFGDGAVERAGVVGEREIAHEYSRAGDFQVEVAVQIPNRSHVERRTVAIAAGK